MTEKKQRQFEWETLPEQTRGTRKSLLEILRIPRFVNHDGRNVSHDTLGKMKALLTKIESHHGIGGAPRLKIKTIASGTNFSEKTIQRAIRNCKHIGLLKVETSKSKKEDEASVYHIQWCEVYQMLFDDPITEPIISRKLNTADSKKPPSSQDNFSGSQDNFSGSQDNFSGSQDNFSGSQDNFSKNSTVGTSLTRARSETSSNLNETTFNRSGDWSEAEGVLKRLGVDKAIEAADQARRNGMDVKSAMSIIQYFDRISKSHKLGPGALVNRLKQKDLSLPVDRGWPIKLDAAAVKPTATFETMDADEVSLLAELETKYLPDVVGGPRNIDVMKVIRSVGLSENQISEFLSRYKSYRCASWADMMPWPRIRLQMLRWLEAENAIPATLTKGAVR